MQKTEMQKITIKGLSDIEDAAQELTEAIAERKVVAFYGEMGAGKTTLISELCRQMGVAEKVCSPSFAIVNVYKSATDATINHFDFYRIRKIEEVYDFGYEEYFYSGDLCLIEWPELIEELLPEDTLRLKITAIDEDTRIIEELKR